MKGPLHDQPDNVAAMPHASGNSDRRGGLFSLIGLVALLVLNVPIISDVTAQTSEMTEFPTGADIIPNDLPAHASQPVLRNQPLSLLPGTIPASDTVIDDADIPSLANQYYQELTGTTPSRPRPATVRKTPDKPTPAATTVMTKPPAATNNTTPAASVATNHQTATMAPTKQVIDTVVATRAAQPTVTTPETAKHDPNGRYLIQLGAFRDTISAESYWASFLVRYPTLSKSHTKQIVTANLGVKGIYHRLQLTGFATFDGAKQQCRQLKADGTDCFASHR
ncbi:SPOR domain-containing protein [uncultured Thalassospira sp.]|uniref:SPOR domain-containing protein n=1 Tax=uncultured Thalassospira sp. TaxID=404382 RepID=UPI00258F2AC9|nr:SPOR domain-containing protein [uncultured Thalassospira sp.]